MILLGVGEDMPSLPAVLFQQSPETNYRYQGERGVVSIRFRGKVLLHEFYASMVHIRIVSCVSTQDTRSTRSG